MLALIPVAGFPWVLERSVVERILQCPKYITQGHVVVADAFEVRLKLEPLMYLSAGPFVMRHFLKHLFHDRRAFRVDNNLAFCKGPHLLDTEWKCG